MPFISNIEFPRFLSEKKRVPNSKWSDKNSWNVFNKFWVSEVSENSAGVFWWVTESYLIKGVFERGIFENEDKQVLTLDSSSSEQWLWSWPLILIAKCSLWYTLNWLNPTILLVIFGQNSRSKFLVQNFLAKNVFF